MIVKYPLSRLRSAAERMPEGREARLLSVGKIMDNELHIVDGLHREIMQGCQTFQRRHFNIAQLKLSSRRQPVGFIDFILSHGKTEGDMVVLDEAAIEELHRRFPPPNDRPAPPAPTLLELAKNFTGAMKAWEKTGFKVVKQAEYEHRHAVCQACQYWLPDARLGLGKCKKCGCSRVKLWLISSRCPDKPPRW